MNKNTILSLKEKDLSLIFIEILSEFNKKILNKKNVYTSYLYDNIAEIMLSMEIDDINKRVYLSLFVKELENLIDNLENIISRN